jgi:amino acid permease
MTSKAAMKERRLVITIGYLVYLAIVFLMLYETDKRLLAVFCALGSALYVALMQRLSDKQSSK